MTIFYKLLFSSSTISSSNFCIKPDFLLIFGSISYISIGVSNALLSLTVKIFYVLRSSSSITSSYNSYLLFNLSITMEVIIYIPYNVKYTAIKG